MGKLIAGHNWVVPRGVKMLAHDDIRRSCRLEARGSPTPEGTRLVGGPGSGWSRLVSGGVRKVPALNLCLALFASGLWFVVWWGVGWFG